MKRWQQWTVATVLGVLAAIAIGTAQRSQGIARDEVVYMRAGSSYASFWIDLASGKEVASVEGITRRFGGPGATDNNREHPPLMKTLFGLSERLFHQRLGWCSQLVGYRLPNAIFGGLLVALVFVFTARRWGGAEGLVAAALVFFLPRGFFHFQLAAFDAPIVTLWFACLYAYYVALGSRWGFVLLGLCFGLLLATKHNAIMLPVALAVHWGWYLWRTPAKVGGAAEAEDETQADDEADADADQPGARAPRRWRRLASKLGHARPQVWLGLFGIAPLVLIAVWPWLWFDTTAHIADWLAFHFHHVHYNFEYLGRNWNAPPFPWHVALVTTLFTVPVVTLVAAAMGGTVLVEGWRRGRMSDPRRAPGLLLLLSLGVAMGPFLLRTTPIFGAEKHWAAAIPSLCIYAGIGVVAVGRAASLRLGELWPVLGARLGAGAIGIVLGAAVVLAAAAETIDAHPHALSHYNALAGGAPGGADLGMNRQFWGYSASGVLDELERYAPAPGEPPVPVYTHDASPAWPLYRKLGWLPPGLPNAGHEAQGIARSKLALVVHERHFRRHDFMIWQAYGTVAPAFVLTSDGVPIVSVYARPGLEPPPTDGP